MHFLFAGETQANQIMDRAIYKGQWEHCNYIYIQTSSFMQFQVLCSGWMVHCNWNQMKRGPQNPLICSYLKWVQLPLSQKEPTPLLLTCTLTSFPNAASEIKCFPVDNAGVTSEKRAHSVNTKGGSQFWNYNWSSSSPFQLHDFSFSSVTSLTL